MRNLFVLLLGSTLPFFGAHGLTTAYVSFEHPEGWRCELSQGVWICQSTVDKDRKESVVLSIATLAGEWDTLDNYEQYLKQPRTIQDERGKPIPSKITYTRRRNINGTTWVDSLQSNSELPGFWARYLATVHNKLAILITYIVSEDRYSQMAPQFERMVSSLKPNAEFDLNIASKQGEVPLPGSTKLGPSQQKNILAERLNVKRPLDGGAAAPEETGGSSTGLYLILALVVGAIVFLRIRKQRANSKKPIEPTSSGRPLDD